MYKLTGVTKLYQKGRLAVAALQDLDLTISSCEWLAVQGRTGHGKSTLLNLLGALDRPTEGTIELDGTDLGRQPDTQLKRPAPGRSAGCAATCTARRAGGACSATPSARSPGMPARPRNAYRPDSHPSSCGCVVRSAPAAGPGPAVARGGRGPCGVS